MAGEPETDGRSRESAILRPGARVLLFDAHDRVLLIQSEWDGRWLWFTPGGALSEGESPEEAARREVTEETSLDAAELAWGPCVWLRRWVWHWAEKDRWYDSREHFFVARLPRRGEPVQPQGADHEEIAALGEARWWDLEELRASGEPVTPLSLLELLPPVIAGKYPDQPLRIEQ